MNARQRKFAQNYLKNPNAKEAAISAGYSKKTAKEKGYQLLQNKEIQEYLSGKREVVEEQTGVDLKWCIDRLKEISDRCMTAIPVMEFDYDKKQMVKTGEYEFDSSGANKSTELIGKHLGIFEKDNAQKKQDIVIKQNVIKLANGDEISI